MGFEFCKLRAQLESFGNILNPEMVLSIQNIHVFSWASDALFISLNKGRTINDLGGARAENLR